MQLIHTVLHHKCFWLATLGAAVLAGCLTPEELRANRIDERKAAFAAFPAETQNRLRAGHLQTGDTTNAAWIVFGQPTRVYSRVLPGSTNLVWSYISTDPEPYDDIEPVWYPFVSHHRQYYLEPGYAIRHGYYYNHNEYLRIEFKTNHVYSIDFFDTNHE